MINKKIVLGSAAADALSPENIVIFEAALESYANYKIQDAALKTLAKQADTAKREIQATLKALVADLKDDYEITITGQDNHAFVISSRASKETYLTVQDCIKKVESLSESLVEMQTIQEEVSKGAKVVKTAPKITTFDVKQA